MKSLRYLLLPLVLGSVVLWAFWTTIHEMAERWVEDPQYSHGYLVPLFSAFLLWFRRREIRDLQLAPSWWGSTFLVAGIGLWALGTLLFFNWFAAISLLSCLMGLAVVTGGWPALRWSWQPIMFLGFMVPLPFRIQNTLGASLQAIATKLSCYLLQTFGAPAISEGNVILINDVKLGIAEACSGLGMLVTFVALATAIVLLLRSADWWQRIALVLSALPVAIIANVVRITVTGLLYNAAQHELARVIFHDVAGWLMMPLAVALLFAELHVLRRLVVDRSTHALDKKSVFGMPGNTGPALAAAQPGPVAS